jgi:hypothetical protein
MQKLIDQTVTALSLDELDQLERAIYQESANIWDQICWELKPAKKSELKAQIAELGQKSQAVYAARFELYARLA